MISVGGVVELDDIKKGREKSRTVDAGLSRFNDSLIYF